MPPMSSVQVACYDDVVHNLTEPDLDWFAKNPSSKHFIMILSALACDFVLLTMLYKWTFYSKSWRFPMALTANYLMRLLIIQIYFMKVPEMSAWTFPGWYSLSVQYGPSNTTHFNLHVALLTVCLCEQRSMKSKLYIPTYFVIAMAIVLLLTLRGCFFIDIVGAVAFGQFFWYFSELWSSWIDVKVFGLLF